MQKHGAFNSVIISFIYCKHSVMHMLHMHTIVGHDQHYAPTSEAAEVTSTDCYGSDGNHALPARVAASTTARLF